MSPDKIRFECPLDIKPRAKVDNRSKFESNRKHKFTEKMMEERQEREKAGCWVLDMEEKLA